MSLALKCMGILLSLVIMYLAFPVPLYLLGQGSFNNSFFEANIYGSFVAKAPERNEMYVGKDTGNSKKSKKRE